MTTIASLHRPVSHVGRASLFLLVLALAAAPPALAAPAIPNPSFELNTFTVSSGTIANNTPITGWTGNPTNQVGQNPAAGSPFADNGIIPNGTRVAFVQSTGSTSTLSTTITGLVVGTSYRVQFRANGRDNNGLSAPPAPSYRLNGGAPVKFSASKVNSTGAFTNPYLTISAIFTATATTAALEISNTTATDSTLLVDNFTIAPATNITVTNTNDSGAGSLRAALTTAAATPEANVITFAAGLNGGTITLAGEIVVNDAGGVVIDASSLPNGLTIDGGAGTNRIFSVATGTLMSLRTLTLTGGNGTGATSTGNGGAILNQGTLSLTGCTLLTNSAPGGSDGGAIFNNGGQLALTQCTLSGNSGDNEGGAIKNESGSVALTHCTLSGNTSTAHGGGITNYANLTLTNTILAGNISPSEADIDNFGGTTTRVGANVVQVHVNGGGGTDSGPAAINANPLLTALANNGGPTQTMAIAFTSPARNAAVGSTVTTDQRGLPVVGTPDIGAFEMQAGVFSLSSATYQTPEGTSATITINRTVGFTGTATVRVFTTNGSAGAADFTGRPNTAASDVIFSDGDTSKSVDIPTVADFLPEGNETFLVSLGSPTPLGATLGFPSMATVTIVDAFQVTNTNDDGDGSLRQAIADAKANPGPDRIYFAPALNGKLIVLSSEIGVTDSAGVTVDASSLAAGITIDAGPGSNRIFSNAAGSILALRGFTLTGGSFTNGTSGGAILNSGTMTVTRCTLTGNNLSGVGAGGGAVASLAGSSLLLEQCTIAGNTARFGGGVLARGAVTLRHCTVSGNTGTNGTGGMVVETQTTTLENTIVAGNVRNDASTDKDIGGSGGTLALDGANVIGIQPSTYAAAAPIGSPNANGDFVGSSATPVDAGLSALANNGGPTQTVALLANSPALNAAVGSMVTTDQRGRPIVGTPDIGAFEAQTGGAFMLSQSGYSTNEGTAVTLTIMRAGGFAGAAKVRLFTTPVSASAADFTGHPNSAASDIDFAATDAVKTVMINTTADALAEANETFTATLSLPAPVAPGVTLGSPSTAMVTIIDPSASSNVADTLPPGIPVITTPAANAVLSLNVGDSTVITGTATDNKGVSTVTASVNGGAAIPLTPTSPGAPSTGFSGALTGLVAGFNSVTVTATDFAGRNATSTTRSFKVLRPLQVIVSGTGGVTPAGSTPKSFKEVGQSVTLTATPGTGAMFSSWTILSGHTTGQLGILASALQKPTLTFLHREGLALRANFVVNPYGALAAAGTVGTDYTGLIHADPMSPAPGGTAPGLDTEGHLKVTLMSTGAFSGLIKMGGTTLAMFSGSFDPGGTARFGTARATTVAVARTGKPSLQVALTIDLSPGRMKDTISGTLTATGFLASQITAISKVTADRAFYDGITNIVPAAYLGAANATQAYTVLFPQTNNAGVANTDYPQGDGYGFLTVSKDGLVTLTSGKLADGTVVTGSFKLSKGNTFPLFLQLYPSGALTRGYLKGDVTLNAAAIGSDMSAQNDLTWLRPTDTTQQYYPGGWPGIIKVSFAGARYAAAFAPVSSVLRKGDGGDGDLIGDPLNAPDLVNGNANLNFINGKLSGTLSKLVSITPANAITKVPSNDASFTLNAFNLSNGAFTGKFVHELDDGVPSPAMIDFQGALYQKGPNAGGYGYFLTRQPTPIDFLGESGVVILFGTP